MPVAPGAGTLGKMDLYARHHAYLERELPFLCGLALRVRGVHTADDQSLSELVGILARLRAELEAHVTLQQRMLRRPWGWYEGELLERHARELQAEFATVSDLTDGFRLDRVVSDEHGVLVRRLAALAADTEHHLQTERELLGMPGVPLSAA